MRVLTAGLIAALLVSTIGCGKTEEANKGEAARPSNSNNSPPAGEDSTTTPGYNASLGRKPPEKSADDKKEALKTAAADSKPAAKINAAQIFSEQKCTTCHGENGKGKLKGAPDFTDAAWQRKEKDAELIEAVKEGKKPKMPGFGSKLKEEEIKAVVAYVRSFAKK